MFQPLPFTRASDLVLVARLQKMGEASTSGGGTVGESQALAGLVLKVDVVYKGAVPLGDIRVTYTLPAGTRERGFSYDVPPPSRPFLYFISRRADGLTFYDPLKPGFPVLDTRPTVRPGASVVESVKAELVQDLRLGSDDLAIRALEALWVSSEAIRAAEEIAADEGRSPDLRAYSLFFLQQARDPGSIEQAISFIEKVRNRPRGPYWVQLVAAGMNGYELTERQIDQLVALRQPAVDRLVGNFFFSRRDAPGAAHYVAVAVKIVTGDVDAATLQGPDGKELRYYQVDAYLFLAHIRGRNEDMQDFAKNRVRDIADVRRWWETEGRLKYGSKRKDGGGE